MKLKNLGVFCDAEEGEGQLSEWAEGQYATGSSQIKASVPPVETASLATANEIREAASQDPYPKWIYGALVTPDPPLQQNFTPGNGSIHGDYQMSQGPPPRWGQNCNP